MSAPETETETETEAEAEAVSVAVARAHGGTHDTSMPSRPLAPHAEHAVVVQRLKVLATIRENDKLQTHGGEILVDSAHPGVQWLTRWIASEGRTRNIDAVEKLFLQAFRMCTELLKKVDNTRSHLHETDERMQQLRAVQQFTRMRDAIYTAVNGVRNLCVTYRDDTSAVARLTTLVDDIHDRLVQVHIISPVGT